MEGSCYYNAIYIIAGYFMLLGIFTIVGYIGHFDTIKERLVELCKIRGLKLLFLTLVEMSVVIGFIFGIHADILSGYDKNKSDSHQNYDWFYSKDIVRFPIDQILLKENPRIEDTKFDFSKANHLVKGNKANYLILVDKTLSSQLPRVFDDASLNIKSGFYTYLNEKRANYSSLNTTATRPLNDLIALSMLKRIYEMKAFMPVRPLSLSLMCYLGGDSLKSLGSKSSADPINNLPPAGIIDQVDKMDTLLGVSKPKKDYGTNLTCWFTNITNTIIGNKFENNSTIIVLISDFVHDGDISALEYEIKNFRKSILAQTHQLCLIQYPFRKSKYETINEKNREKASAALNLFKENFDNIYVYPMITDKYLRDRNGFYSFLNCLNYTSDVENTNMKDISYAYFYKPALSNTSMNLSVCSFPVKDTGLYSFVLRCTSGNGYKGAYLKCNLQNEYLFIDEPVLLHISNAPQKLCFSAFNIQGGTDYFIEVSKISEGDFFRFRIPVVFREVLPKTSSYFLLVTYLVWFLIFAYFLILFAHRYVSVCLGRRQPLVLLYIPFTAAVIYLYIVSISIVFRQELLLLAAIYSFIVLLASVFFIKYLIASNK